MDHFKVAMAKTVLVEGGYADDPKDSGGKTMYGVTEKVAREEGYMGPMNEMPQSVAVAIYRKRYWDPLKLAAVATFYPAVAYEMFDSAVNLGQGTAAKWFQRVLNALNNEESLFKDVEVDGAIGPQTLGSLRAFAERRGETGGRVLLAALNGIQAAEYIALTERRPKDERFVYGWLAQRVVGE